jgi:hypothetical protein
LPRPSLFRIASAMIERAELPVQRKSTLIGLRSPLVIIASERPALFGNLPALADVPI